MNKVPLFEENKLTLAKVNKAIQAKHPLVKLVRGNGYYYLVSDDDDMGLKLAGLYSTSIMCNSIKDQPLERWVGDVDELMKEIDNEKGYSDTPQAD